MFEGETYYINKNNITDSSYIIPHEILLCEIASAYLRTIDYNLLNNEKIKEIIDFAKENKAYAKGLELCLFFYERNKTSVEDIKDVLPSITSMYRHLNRPREAIDFNSELNRLYGKSIFSVHSLTSIGAAYCDIKDYDKAKKFCDIAYAKQGGGQGTTNELSLVYKRIEKETGQKF